LPITFSGAGVADFSIVEVPSDTILPGESTNFSIRFSPSTEGTSEAAITIMNNDADEGSFTVAIAGEARTAFDLTMDSIRENNGVLFVSNLNLDDGVTYQWIDDCGDGNNPIVGDTLLSFTPPTSDSANYSVIVTDAACETAPVTLPCFEFSPNPTGIDELTAAGISFYPNPVENELTIDLTEATNNTEISVLNIQGQTIYSEKFINSNRISVNMEGWAKGVYFVDLKKNESNNRFRIIKN